MLPSVESLATSQRRSEKPTSTNMPHHGTTVLFWCGKNRGHSSLRSLGDVAQLSHLQKAIRAQQQTGLEPATAGDVLEIVGHDTDQHVLPRELKKQNRIVPLLAETLERVLRNKGISMTD